MCVGGWVPVCMYVCMRVPFSTLHFSPAPNLTDSTQKPPRESVLSVNGRLSASWGLFITQGRSATVDFAPSTLFTTASEYNTVHGIALLSISCSQRRLIYADRLYWRISQTYTCFIYTSSSCPMQRAWNSRILWNIALSELKLCNILFRKKIQTWMLIQDLQSQRR